MLHTPYDPPPSYSSLNCTSDSLLLLQEAVAMASEQNQSENPAGYSGDFAELGSVSKSRIKEILVNKLHLTEIAEERKFYQRFLLSPPKLKMVERSIDKLPSNVVKSSLSLFFRNQTAATEATEVTDDEIYQWFIKQQAATWLHRKICASGWEDIERIIRDSGVDINAQSQKSGNTPLISAFKHGKNRIAYELLNAGARYDLFDHNGRRPIQLSITASVSDVDAKKFINKMKSTIDTHTDPSYASCSSFESNFNSNSINRAANQGFLESFKLLKRLGCQVNNITIIYAVRSSSDTGKIIEYLSNKYPDLDYNYVDFNGMTPLMHAARCDNYSALEALLKIADVKNHINIKNHENGYSWTAYTYASDKGHYWCKQLLVANGAMRKSPPIEVRPGVYLSSYSGITESGLNEYTQYRGPVY